MQATVRTFLLTLLLTSLGAAGQGIDLDKALAARIVDVHTDDRTITVEFEDNDVQGTYPVAADAEFYTYSGKVRVPQEFDDLHAGQDVLLEFDDIGGKVTLRKVTSGTQDNAG